MTGFMKYFGWTIAGGLLLEHCDALVKYLASLPDLFERVARCIVLGANLIRRILSGAWAV